MQIIKECGIYLVGLFLPFVIGPVVPVGGFIALAVFFLYFFPRFIRACRVFKAQQFIEQRKRRIETRVMQGRLDGELTREVVGDMQQRGEL